MLTNSANLLVLGCPGAGEIGIYTTWGVQAMQINYGVMPFLAFFGLDSFLTTVRAVYWLVEAKTIGTTIRLLITAMSGPRLDASPLRI